jgi:bleomycin hydrolase
MLKNMKPIIASLTAVLLMQASFAQPSANTAPEAPQFFDIKTLKATPVKNQEMTNTCWCFSATSLLESEEIRREKKELDLSEMFTVRNIYFEKAKNYILRDGRAQFGEGGLGHDVIRSVANYGAVPQEAYTGLLNGQTTYDHRKLYGSLKQYLDSILRKQPISSDWMDGFTKILDNYLGVPPTEFDYSGKKYTPQSFAKDVLNFNAADYVSLTSFTHQPYYRPFILQVPDNFANGSFYNLPLDEFISVIKDAVSKGYTVAWDADVSNKGFMQNAGLALNLDAAVKYSKDMIAPDLREAPYDAKIRQQLYENLTTQDDHLMHITGVEKSKDGKTFFVVKNSWGKIGPYEGYIQVSEAYVAINTISIVVPKQALSKEVMAKLGLK